MENLNQPAIDRYDLPSSKQPPTNLIYEGMCTCGSVLYKWTSTEKLFCHNCANPRKNLKR